MAERTETFEILENPLHSAKIKVIGVGGAGGNAVEHMINRKVTGIEYYCANTDAQALDLLNVGNKIQLGAKITRGLGAGADPDVGRAAALEDREQMVELLQGADMVFIAAGMGGGTGTGAAPVIAEVAADMGILTVAVVNRPFPFEQRKRIALADKGVVDLARHVDSLIIVPNGKLLEVLPPDTTIVKAFEAANDVLHDAVKGISDIITKPGLINVDFSDVKTVMSKRGMAMMGTGIASRDDSNPGGAAARAAISSPLLENIDVGGAAGILINVSGGEHLTLKDMAAVGEVTREVCDLNDDMLIPGMVVDPGLGDKVQVTLVATGLWGKAFQTDGGSEQVGAEHAPQADQPPAGRRSSMRGGVGELEKSQAPRGKRAEKAAQGGPAEPSDLERAKAKKAANAAPANLDYLDIPAFLRWNVD